MHRLTNAQARRIPVRAARLTSTWIASSAVQDELASWLGRSGKAGS